MKILVTGATGFIGNYVIWELLKNGHHVIATSSNESKAKGFRWYKEVQYFSLDFSELQKEVNYFHFFNSPDIIIHLAWEGLPNYESLFHIDENLPRHYLFLKNIIINGGKDITIAGTCMEYGLQEGMLNEEMPSSPSTRYAIAKDTLRKFLEQLQKLYPFNMKWGRLFYVYGKGQNPKALLPQLERALQNGEKEFNMSGGEQQRDYLPVEKMAEYIVKIALQKKITGIINCCSGVPITINQLVENYLSDKKQKIKLNKGFYPYSNYEPMNFWGDDEKLKKVIWQ